MKRVVSLVIILGLVFTLFNVNAMAASDITVKVDGKVIIFPDAQPFINSDNRTLVPVRFVSEALNSNVSWEDSIKTVTIKKGSDTITLKIGESRALKNGQEKTFDTKALISESRTFVPLRFVSEALGAEVQWIPETKTVEIVTGTTPLPQLSQKQVDILNSYPANKDSDVSGTGFYKSNSEYIKLFGIDSAQKMVDLAKGYIETFNNKDYRTIGEEYRQKMRLYRVPVDYDLIEDNIQKVKDYKIIVEGMFLTDTSMVYASNEGSVRVKGTLRYCVHSCTDTASIYGQGIKTNQWVEEDIEISFFTNGSRYYFEKKILLSKTPRY